MSSEEDIGTLIGLVIRFVGIIAVIAVVVHFIRKYW